MYEYSDHSPAVLIRSVSTAKFAFNFTSYDEIRMQRGMRLGLVELSPISWSTWHRHNGAMMT